MSEITLAATETTQEADGCPVVGLPFGLSDRIGRTGWRRFASLAVTIGIHVAVVAAFCVATHEAHAVRPEAPVISVSLLPEQPKPTELNLAMAKPTLVQPQAVTMVAPIFKTSSPVSANAISAPPTTHGTPHHVNEANLKNLWAAKLIARLSALKRYPAAAVAARAQGVVWLHFVIDRAGRVLRADIQQSSGYDALDKEALALAYRAQPLPKPPAGLPGESFSLAVPIRFALN